MIESKLKLPKVQCYTILDLINYIFTKVNKLKFAKSKQKLTKLQSFIFVFF